MGSKRNYLEGIQGDAKSLLDTMKSSCREDQTAVFNIWKEDFSPEFELFDSVFAFFVFFLELLRKKKKISRFEKAFLILSSKMVSDGHGARLCVEHGWTGTALGMLRMFHSAHNMILFLAYFPEHLESWFSEEHDSYQKDRKFKELFSEANVFEGLKKKGFIDTKSSFHLLSKGLHGAHWGMQVYTDQGTVAFQPRPDFFKTLLILSEIPATISALVNWFIEKMPDSFRELFSNEEDRKAFQELHSALNSACGHIMERVSSFIVKTQDDREQEGGPLLKRLDPDELKAILEEVSGKGDPSLK